MLRPPDPPLSDGVVTLRPFRPDDAPAVAAACGDPEIPRWTTVPTPYGPADAEAFLARTAQGWEDGVLASFAVTAAEDEPTLLGAIDCKLVTSVSAEIGYWVAAFARGHGVATRALELVRTWALEDCGLQVVTLQVLVGNEASRRVAEAADFRHVGKVEADVDGTHHEALLLACTRDGTPSARAVEERP